jgi:hypothetical protein
VDTAIKVTLIVLGIVFPILALMLMVVAYSALMEAQYGYHRDVDSDFLWYVGFAFVAFVGYVALIMPRIWQKTFVEHAEEPVHRVEAVRPLERVASPEEIEANRLVMERFTHSCIQEAMTEHFGADPIGAAVVEYKQWIWAERVKRIPRPTPRSSRPLPTVAPDAPSAPPISGLRRYSTLRDGFLSPVLEGQRSEDKPIVRGRPATPESFGEEGRQLLSRSVSDDGTVVEAYIETVFLDDETLAAIAVESAA